MCRKWWKQALKSDTFLTHAKTKEVASQLLTTFIRAPNWSFFEPFLGGFGAIGGDITDRFMVYSETQ